MPDRFLSLNAATDRYVIDINASGEDDNDGRQEECYPIQVRADEIAFYYARRGNRIGTRLTLRNGYRLPVRETTDVIDALLAQWM